MMKKTIARLLPALILLAGMASCSLFDKEEKIPAYLYIAPFKVETTPWQGSNNQRITEGWLYVNNQFIGAYYLPATIPVLEDSIRQVILFPGIREIGPYGPDTYTGFYPDIYNLLDRYETSVNLKPGKVDTLLPVTRYIRDISYPLNEGFEGNPIFTDRRNVIGNTTLEVTTNDAFEGRSGQIRLDSVNPYLEVASVYNYRLPTDRRRVYIEVNHKNDVPFEIGIIGQDSATGTKSARYTFGLNAKSEWHKSYINITEDLWFSQLSTYQVGIRAYLPYDLTGNFTKKTGLIKLDNIRVVFKQ